MKAFQNSNFCLEVPILSLATNTSFVFLEVTAHFVPFEKTFVKYPSLNNHSLPISLSFT